MPTGERERRAQLRFSQPVPALARGRETTFARADVRDFGQTGARLLVKEALPAGSPLSLNLRLDSRRLVSVETTVQWSRPQGDGETEVGVRFSGGCQADLQCLQGWLYRQLLLRQAG